MRQRTFHRLACLLLFATCTAGWAQVPTGSIIGVVRVLRGTFPEPVLVSLEFRGATIATCYTDGEGRFAFNHVATNPYRVTIRDERYMPVDVQVIVRPDYTPINVLQLMLQPQESKSAISPGPHVVGPSDLAKTYPKNAVKEFGRGVKAESEGKADEAIEHYRKAIKEAPTFAIAHNNLGSLLVSKSNFPAAQTEFEQSMRLDPGDAKPCFNLANLMLLTGKLDQAEHYLQDGFRKQPDSAFGFFVQGSVLERTGKYADAERALRRALELDPKMPRPHLELVNLYLREHRSPDAISELQTFLRVAPADPLAPKAREVLGKLEASTLSPRK